MEPYSEWPTPEQKEAKRQRANVLVYSVSVSFFAVLAGVAAVEMIYWSYVDWPKFATSLVGLSGSLIMCYFSAVWLLAARVRLKVPIAP